MSIIIPSLKEIDQQMSECKLMLMVFGLFGDAFLLPLFVVGLGLGLFFFSWNHLSWTLSLEYWSEKIKRVWSSLNQQVSIAYQMLSKSIEAYEITGVDSFAFLHPSNLDSRSRAHQLVSSSSSFFFSSSLFPVWNSGGHHIAEIFVHVTVWPLFH